MKILFIENRNKTYLYENIIKNIPESDLKVSWIVFNKVFTPRSGDIYFIGKSKRHNERVFSESMNKIIKADRGKNYFDVKSNYHFYSIQNEIVEILELIKPNLIIGEATSFHEQMVINWARKNDTLYLHPTSNRYPPYRFSFYLYDTLIPFEGSGEKLQEQEAGELIEKINAGLIKPDYMTSVPISTIERVKYYSKIIRSNILGEKYYTPSIRKKIILDSNKKIIINKWNNNSFDGIKKEDNLFYVLYPLQMQPEMNLEYWGYPYNNQVELIQYIVENTDKNVRVIVKPNPKSKYEMTKELYDLCCKNNKIIPLSHSVKMNEIIDLCDLIFTNTGTVSFEAFFKNIPLFTIGNLNNKFIQQKMLAELNCTIDSIVKKNYHFPNITTKIEFINYLLAASYRGVIGDVYLNKGILSGKNIEHLAYAFSSVIEKAKKNNIINNDKQLREDIY